jgi:phage repressor protein C with HTH and peptisase S24 domain
MSTVREEPSTIGVVPMADGSKEVELSAGARWLARYHAAQFKLHRWAPDPLLAIRISDDSMEDKSETATWGDGKNYPKGCTVVVDPRVDAKPGQRVIVEIDGIAMLRELGRYRGNLILKPTNRAYATIPLERWHKIRGVVVQVRIMTEAGERGEAEWAARQASQEATAA